MSEIKLAKHRGIYVATYLDEGGVRRRRSLGTSDISLAKTRLGEFRRNVTLLTQSDIKTVAQIFDAYVKDRTAEGVAAASRIEDAGKALKPHFGHMLPSHITKPICRDYIRLRRNLGRKDGTIHTELTYLRSAFTFAQREGIIQLVPYVLVPQKPDPRNNFLTREEADKLIAAAVMPHAKLFIIVALNTAGRMQAILDLTWARVDMKKGLIDLRDPEKDRTKKGRAIIPINAPLRTALEAAKEGAVSDYVIEWGGEKVGNIKKAMSAASKRSGIECTAHDLRRTAAVWMAERGVPMREISLYLGHTNSQTTERVYARHSPDFLKDAAKALEG